MKESIKASPWSQPVSEVVTSLNSDLSNGLFEANRKSSSELHGKNILHSEKTTSRLRLLLQQFNNPMVYILVLATGISMLMGEFIDSIAILAIVIINASIGYAQESKAEDAISSLAKLTLPKARVLREGKIQSVDSIDIVPGDILQLEAGDYVVADARIVEAHQLTCNESVLTGESMPVEKSINEIMPSAELAERTNMLFASTAINAGTGKAIVVAICMQTEIGNIASLMKETKNEITPLQKRLNIVSNKLLLVGGIIIALVALLGLIRGEEWLNILMSAISLAVSAIPEGLPTVVTLALTLAVRRMTKRNALVRNMSAVETLGSTDIICTDKTGTLTTGMMEVREVFNLSENIVSSSKFKGDDLFFKALILCNNSSLDYGGSGDTTELALLLLAKQHNLDVTKVREDNVRLSEWSFESVRKRMSVAVASDGKTIIFCKGAPESLIPLCNLTSSEQEIANSAIIELSNIGRRMLAIAYKNIDSTNFSEVESAVVENNFKFLGLVAIADPPKEETIPAIQACIAAGIKVVMITGDHPLTANAIAVELGIAQKGSSDLVVTGKELDSLSPEEIKKLVETTSIYARVTPEHKLKIIEALQSNGHIVSMTGDGVNDAPALKKASIGIAMGKAGTEVARQASSIILTDDNFATIVSAVEEGRAIFGNIKRTIQYLLSTNLGELLIMFLAALFGFPIPLTPLALLWMNLVTDGFPSLALAAEPVEKNFLKTSKRPSAASFFDKRFMWELFSVALLMTFIVFSVYAYALKNYDVTTAKSYAFTLLICSSLFRSFSSRSQTKLFFQMPFNPWHIASVLIPLGLQFGLQHTENFQKFFRVRSLNFNEILVVLLLSLIPVTMLELYKLIKKK